MSIQRLLGRPWRVASSKAYLRSIGRSYSTPTVRSDLLRISEEVQDAVKTNRPVVALETTIYTHGWSYPENHHLATHLEQIVRQGGAVPATIGMLDGTAHVGMNEKQLCRLLEQPKARKISRRDLAFALGSGSSVHGGTTISGTAVLSHLAGVPVFATGGLGGVHKGGQDSMDISADLTELGRTPVAVICSGCKGFLDIPRTLEYLETQGAAVATFADGRHGNVDFPAFWSRDSGVRSPEVIRDEQHAAEVIHAQLSLGLQSGLLLANPVPAESSISRQELDKMISQAIQMAEEASAIGSANTPFILDAIKTLSNGRSVTANLALVAGNVRRGAEVARRLSSLRLGRSQESTFHTISVNGNRVDSKKQTEGPRETPKPVNLDARASNSLDILVAGSIAVDVSCDYTPVSSKMRKKPRSHTSNPANISQSVGGVGFNVARAAQLAGANVKLCSIIGNDSKASEVRDALSSIGLPNDGLQVSTAAELGTAQYVAFNDADKNLSMAMADMRILETPPADFEHCWQPHIEALADRPEDRSGSKWLVVDANWDAHTLHEWLRYARQRKIGTAFEPVSVEKSARLFDITPDTVGDDVRLTDIAAPNEHELFSLYEAARSSDLMQSQGWWSVVDALGIPSIGARTQLAIATSSEMVDEGTPQRIIQLLPFVPNLLVKLGPKGVLLTRILPQNDPLLNSRSPNVLSRSKTGQGGVGGLYMRLIPPKEVLGASDIVSVNGAGDTFLGAVVARLAKEKNPDLEAIVESGQDASAARLRGGHLRDGQRS